VLCNFEFKKKEIQQTNKGWDNDIVQVAVGVIAEARTSVQKQKDCWGTCAASTSTVVPGKNHVDLDPND